MSADAIVKRSVTIAGHRTSVSLEAPFWDALRDIARQRGVPTQILVGRDRLQGADRAKPLVRHPGVRAEVPHASGRPAP